MPAYSFQKQFVPFVESGEKTHTIRGKRKNRPKPGQTFYAYYGMRTKQCRKLLESSITRVQDILIDVDHLYCDYIDAEHIMLVYPRIVIDGESLADDEMEALARRDGFSDLRAMMMFWPRQVLPFSGDIIHWKPVTIPEGNDALKAVRRDVDDYTVCALCLADERDCTCRM